MKRVLLTVAYDGTNYHGWQAQDNANTIEAELNKALTDLVNEKIEVIGASRTDTGVHALGNLAVFDTEMQMPAEKFSYALNARLPEDIRVVGSHEVPLDFHPRKTGMKKRYEYHIYSAEFPSPVRRLYSHFTYHELDVGKMQEAAQYLVGEHDFTSMCSVNAQSDSKVRTIYDISVIKHGPEIIISVVGSGFLYNMVRIIAGTLMEVGMGRKPAAWVGEALEARNREAAGPTAPACGLVLVGYEE